MKGLNFFDIITGMLSKINVILIVVLLNLSWYNKRHEMLYRKYYIIISVIYQENIHPLRLAVLVFSMKQWVKDRQSENQRSHEL